jgi:hypothetical protein
MLPHAMPTKRFDRGGSATFANLELGKDHDGRLEFRIQLDRIA